MKVVAVVNGVERSVHIERTPATGSNFSFSFDEQVGQADICEVFPGVYSILLGSRCFEVKIEEGPESYIAAVAGRRYNVAIRDPRKFSREAASPAELGSRKLTAPMPGRVVRVLAAEGAEVQLGDGLVVVEAMKMQNEIKSPKAGTIRSVHVKEGASVGAGELLIVVD